MKLNPWPYRTVTVLPYGNGVRHTSHITTWKDKEKERGRDIEIEKEIEREREREREREGEPEPEVRKG